MYYYLHTFTLQAMLHFLIHGSSLSLLEVSFSDYLIRDLYLNKLNKCFFLKVNVEQIKPHINDKTDYLEGSSGKDMQKVVKDIGKKVNIKRYGEIYLNEEPKFIILIKYYNLYFDEDHRDILLNFVSDYINQFKQDNLFNPPHERNFLSFKNNISKTKNTFEALYRKNNTFNMKFPTIKKLCEGEFRFCEILLYFVFQGHLSIERCELLKVWKNNPYIDDYYEYEQDFRLSFKISPKEIQKKEGAWLIFKDLSLNQITGESNYKDNTYKFGTHGKKFKLLLYLLENEPPARFNVYKVFDLLWPELKDKSLKIKKIDIESEVKEIKRNLRISSDKKRTIDIRFVEKDYIVIEDLN